MARSNDVDARLWALEQAIHRRRQRERSWRVVAGTKWLCPYCGKIGVDPYRESRAAKDILEHLVADCTEWGDKAVTQFGYDELMARGRHLEIEHRLGADPVWQVRDSLGRWCCPYHGGSTGIRWDPDLPGARPPLATIVSHLNNCGPHRQQRKAYALDALRLLVDDADAYRDALARARLGVQEDPRWRQASPDGSWVCPECRRPVPEVDVSSDLLLTSIAPVKMARHLVDRCGRENVDPAPVARAEAPAAPDNSRNLERAREIVQKMLPAEVPVVEGFELYCLYRPTESVGGDFYDYFRLSDHEVGFAMGDVSGHGLEGALIMTMVRKSLEIHARQYRSPAEVLRRTNEDIHNDLDARTFVTVCYAVLDARASTVTFARAGHNLPILFNPDRREPIRHLPGKGIALGMYRGGLFDQALQETEIRLQPGDVFLFYTDGLTEARNQPGEQYGLERLGAALAGTHGDYSSQSLAGRLFTDVQTFVAGAPQDDDIAILCLSALAKGE
ncbi:PP2C family protein-serine/threonine phosphatase [bacterium]|nr:PP2C family protein-serine/threonine phosphatase [bacterium]